MAKVSSKDPSNESKLFLFLQELKLNPFHEFNVVFALMSVIPFLAFLYVLITRLFTVEVLIGDVGLVFAFTILISLCALLIGYRILKKMLEKIIFYAEIAKKCSVQKSSFVATVSHDLRSPLAVVSTNLEGMLDTDMFGEVTPKQREVLTYCRHVITRMQNLVKNLLDSYKIEAGMVKIKKTQCNLAQLLNQTIEELKIITDKKNISMHVKIADKDLSILAEEGMIIQVLDNLLNNAIKYTPEDSSVTVQLSASSNNYVQIDFIDDGDGIPEEKLEKIFDKFERLDYSKDGIGLGLAIARDIVNLHKGHLWAENLPGSGSKFSVVLPVTEDQEI